MTAFLTPSNDIILQVPHSLGLLMLWDTFKCELKAARICGPRSVVGRQSLKHARAAASLMIGLTGRQTALPMLKAIAQSARQEVRR